MFEGAEAALWTALASRARERILEGTLGAAASGECTGLPYFDRLSPPEKLVLVSNSMIALLCRSVPPPPISLFSELPMYALASILVRAFFAPARRAPANSSVCRPCRATRGLTSHAHTHRL